MSKPTSPQPPETLSDDALLRIARGLKFDSQALDWPENLIIYGRRVYAAGYEARGKRDADLLIRLLKWTSPPGDWACIKCRPQSDMIKAGFLCAWHEAESDIAAIESSSGERPTEREAFEAQYLNQPTGERRDKCRTCGSNNPNRLAGECLRRYADATLPLYNKFHHSLRRRAPR